MWPDNCNRMKNLRKTVGCKRKEIFPSSVVILSQHFIAVFHYQGVHTQSVPSVIIIIILTHNKHYEFSTPQQTQHPSFATRASRQFVGLKRHILHRKGQHLPDTPPYVVFFPSPTAGQGVPSALSSISPDTVLVAVTPSAPPVNNTSDNLNKLVTVPSNIEKYSTAAVQRPLRQA